MNPYPVEYNLWGEVFGSSTESVRSAFYYLGKPEIGHLQGTTTLLQISRGITTDEYTDRYRKEELEEQT